MSWSAHQRRLLDALGYELLVPGRVGASVPAREAAANDAPAGASVAARAAVAGTPGASPLLDALRRAAGGADPSSLIGDLNQLRRDPAGKRALWPRLRALRKGAA
jgi:hypothetical protein